MINYLWENLFKRNEDHVSKVLSNNILFKDLNSSELKTVANFLHIRHYRPAELVFRQNEIGVGMYIILKGRIDILIESNATTVEEDTGDFITRLEEGDLMGELSLIEENSRRTASARAMNEASLIGFFQPDLKNLLQSHPEIGARILLRLSQVLGRRLSETATKITELKKQIQSIKA